MQVSIIVTPIPLIDWLFFFRVNVQMANLKNIRAIFSQQWFSGGSIYNSMYALENNGATLWGVGYNGNYNLGIYQGENMYGKV